MIKKYRDLKIYNILWYMFGLLSYGFTSLVYLIIITRILGVDVTGEFSFAFAVAATLYVVGVYFGSAFQVTDTSNKYSDTDYLYNRFTTCTIMLILTLIICFFNRYSSDKIALIMFLTVSFVQTIFLLSLSLLVIFLSILLCLDGLILI